MERQFQHSPRKLIINADDYGADECVNAAVEELAGENLLGGVSILANGKLWESAATFLRSQPNISAGIHLNLIEGQPLSAPHQIRSIIGDDGNFLNRTRLMRRWLLRPQAVSLAVEREWRAQIERLLQAGIKLTHADSHQHLHAFPLAFRVAVKLCQDYGIPALRLPCEVNAIPARNLTAQALRANLAMGRWITPSTALCHNDHFLGFKRAGGYGINEFLSDLPHLQNGVTELALHPSTKNFRPYPSLRGNDEREAVLSDVFRAEIRRLQIELIRWQAIVHNPSH